MRAIVVMFDSLNRRMLPCYGNTTTQAPNFSRLAERTAVFDTCYAGSMPCMPARREMHTGRYNFLHRSWSPIEPFDDSVPEMLRTAGIYTHLITDHQHYWEDGGATYHNRFSSYEFFRGQEGDLWKGEVAGIDRDQLGNVAYRMRRHDMVNRRHMSREADHPQTGVFDAGLEFITTNADEDGWMVQIETFDPHEPFFSYDRWHRLYPDTGEDFDWPPYDRVTEDEATVAQGRNRYLALLAMCDANLGRVLDLMDERGMWEDTMLIVCTDHGYMLGEKGWWSKSVMPWYDETIHTPFFIWDPRAAVQGERRKSLVQTIDIGPTRHGLTHGQTIYFFDPSGNRNEVFCGGDYFYPDHKPVTWQAEQAGLMNEHGTTTATCIAAIFGGGAAVALTLHARACQRERLMHSATSAAASALQPLTHPPPSPPRPS